MGYIALSVLYRFTNLRDAKYTDVVCQTLDIPEAKITSAFTFFRMTVSAFTLQLVLLKYPIIALASKNMYTMTNIDTKIGGTPNSISR